MGKMIFSVLKWIAKALVEIFGYEIGSMLTSTIEGAALGAISLAINPRYIIPSFQIRFINLIVTPLIVGMLLNLSSNIKFSRKLLTFDLVNFFSGYAFALTLAGIRFFLAK